jgi:hypothetical protein
MKGRCRIFRLLGSSIGRVSDTRPRTITAVLLASLVFTAMGFTLQLLFAKVGVPSRTGELVGAALIGLAFGIVLWFVLASIRERRRRVRGDLERIAQLNHEIRNALEVITHAHFDMDAERRAMVLESVTRIDSVLRHVFPPLGVAFRESETKDESKIPFPVGAVCAACGENVRLRGIISDASEHWRALQNAFDRHISDKHKRENGNHPAANWR